MCLLMWLSGGIDELYEREISSIFAEDVYTGFWKRGLKIRRMVVVDSRVYRPLVRIQPLLPSWWGEERGGYIEPAKSHCVGPYSAPTRPPSPSTILVDLGGGGEEGGRVFLYVKAVHE